MAEPGTTAQAVSVAATTSGLTAFGIATGIEPMYLLAGALGGLYSLSVLDYQRRAERIAAVIAGAILAGGATEFVLHLMLGVEIKALAGAIPYAGFPVASVIGFSTHKFIAPAVARLSKAWAEKVGGKNV